MDLIFSCNGVGGLSFGTQESKKEKEQEAQEIQKLAKMKQLLQELVSGNGQISPANLSSAMAQCMASLDACEKETDEQITELEELKKKLASAIQNLSGPQAEALKKSLGDIDHMIQALQDQKKMIHQLQAIGSMLKGPSQIESFAQLTSNCLEKSENTTEQVLSLENALEKTFASVINFDKDPSNNLLAQEQLNNNLDAGSQTAKKQEAQIKGNFIWEQEFSKLITNDTTRKDAENKNTEKTENHLGNNGNFSSTLSGNINA